MKRPLSRKAGCAALVAFTGILLFAATMVTILLAFAIWPGEAKLTATLFCPDDKPDAFVVTDTYSPQPGETTTNFTLYCMGPRGQVSDEGIFRPFAALTLFHAVVILAMTSAVMLSVMSRRRASVSPPAVGS